MEMPHELWLGVRLTATITVKVAGLPCAHCGTTFTTPEGAGRQEAQCAIRMAKGEFSNVTGEWHRVREKQILFQRMTIAEVDKLGREGLQRLV